MIWNGTIIGRSRHLRRMLKYFILEIIYLLYIFPESLYRDVIFLQYYIYFLHSDL
jgi:hypothetical protein